MADYSGVGTIGSILLLPSRSESQRLNLVMINPIHREVFH